MPSLRRLLLPGLGIIRSRTGKGALIGTIFRKAQNRLQNPPAKLQRLIVDLIDKRTGRSTDIKGDAYEGLLSKGLRTATWRAVWGGVALTRSVRRARDARLPGQPARAPSVWTTKRLVWRTAQCRYRTSRSPGRQ